MVLQKYKIYYVKSDLVFIIHRMIKQIVNIILNYSA